MTTHINRLGVAKGKLNRNKTKRPVTTTLVLNNSDRFLKELTSAECEGRPTTYLIRVHQLKVGTRQTTLVIRTTKG